MRKLLMTLLTAGCVGILSQGYADYPGCGDPCNPPMGPYYGDCCFGNSFDGWYLGGNLGWAFHDRTWVDRDAWVDNFNSDWALGSLVTVNDGVTVGLQTGYNWQCGCALYGIEADANWAHAHRNKHFSPNADGSTTFTRLTFNDRSHWFGTIRARGGVVANNLLLYGTIGAAWAATRHHWHIDDVVADVVTLRESFNDNRTRWGLALGFGIEWLLCQNWTFKVEALFHKFPERHRSGFSTAGAQRVHFDIVNDIWVARVGFNYNFSSLCCCW